MAVGASSAMDYAKRIVEFLSAEKAPRQIVIAPQAPPVNKRAGTVEVAIEQIFDIADVTETLIGLRNYGRRGNGTGLDGAAKNEFALDQSGTFSISVAGVGRFRVSYMTQRGSLAASVARIPTAMTSFDSLFADPDAFDAVTRVIGSGKSGMLAIYGPSMARNSTVAYALLQRVNSMERKVIHMLEHNLSFLLRHDNSVITQSEVGVDVESMEAGIRQALCLVPDLLYIGDLQAADRVPSLSRAVESESLTLVSIVATSRESFLCTLREAVGPLVELIAPRICTMVGVTADEAGWIELLAQ